MNTGQNFNNDPLLAGFYTVADAARLLGISRAKAYGWLNGWNSSASGPIIKRDFESFPTVSFLDLMEMRFIEFFRAQNVPMQTLRHAAARARREWGTDHPFALSKAKYLTDRRKIFAQVAEEDGDNITWDIASGQLEIWQAIETVIAKGVVFDPNTHLAKRWQPKPGDFPSIVVDPKMAFGRPVIDHASVPTSALFRQWKAEKGDKSRVAKWFGVTTDDVSAAVEFELQIAA